LSTAESQVTNLAVVVHTITREASDSVNSIFTTAVPAEGLSLSARVPGGPFSRGCAAKRIGPTFGIRTVGSLNVAA